MSLLWLRSAHGHIVLVVGVGPLIRSVRPLLLLGIASHHSILLFLLLNELENLTAEQLVDGRVVVVWAQLARLENYVVVDLLVHLQLDDGRLQLVKLLLTYPYRWPSLTIGIRFLDADIWTNPAATLFATIRPIASGTNAEQLLHSIHFIKTFDDDLYLKKTL